jgi:hypothetical protein
MFADKMKKFAHKMKMTTIAHVSTGNFQVMREKPGIFSLYARTDTDRECDFSLG